MARTTLAASAAVFLLLAATPAASDSVLPMHPLAVAASDAAPGSCPAGINTACSSNSTCCPVMFSGSNYGCCNLGPDAVCCGQQGCCPAGYTCMNTPPYTTACVKGNETWDGPVQVCTPGAENPATASPLPAIIMIGDSVSIGYEPAVAALLNETIYVQHSPWSGGGGADDIANAYNCRENFVRDAMFTEQSWDAITFNSGLHNLDNATAAEEEYATLLTNFTDYLINVTANMKGKLGKPTRLMYITTTPYMPDRVVGNTVVEDLNARAIAIMQSRGIPIADLYHRVTSFCGPVYYNCSICDNEWNPATNTTCGYHYNPQGWEYLAEFLAPVVSNLVGL
jgi:hypothetical protein